MTTPVATRLLYLDTSAFLRRVFDAEGADIVDAAVNDYCGRGGAVVSSRLLWLEARRVAVREALLGNDIAAATEMNLSGVAKLPVTEEIWESAAAIGQHIKTLDSLHLASCEVARADLLTFDHTMRSVARAHGVNVLA